MKTADQYELEIVRLRQKIIALEGRVSRRKYGALKKMFDEKCSANLQLMRELMRREKEVERYQDLYQQLLQPVDNSAKEVSNVR